MAIPLPSVHPGHGNFFPFTLIHLVPLQCVQIRFLRSFVDEEFCISHNLLTPVFVTMGLHDAAAELFPESNALRIITAKILCQRHEFFFIAILHRQIIDEVPTGTP